MLPLSVGYSDREKFIRGVLVVWGLFFLQLFSSASFALSPEVKAYYASMDDAKDLKKHLFTILDSYHLPKEKEDLILPACSESKCYKHTSLTYKSAREYLFGKLHLKGSSKEGFTLETYYCGEILTADDFGSKNELGDMKIPNDKIVNVEHAWPQSHFTHKFPKNVQKTDLHILFPEISKVNSIRGNFPFGDVETPMNEPCKNVAMGISKEKEKVFEPIGEVKGDMARATFYYVTRYNVNLDKNQEAYLRFWHKADPVDQHELDRNEKIFEVQKIRNPYIDMPELVDQIADF